MNMHFTSNNIKEADEESSSIDTDFDDDLQQQLSSELEFTQTNKEKISTTTLERYIKPIVEENDFEFNLTPTPNQKSCQESFGKITENISTFVEDAKNNIEF